MTHNPALPATDPMLARAVLTAVCLLILFASPAAAAPLGTAFTYQGVLKEAGMPHDSAVDFTFELYDDESSGFQVGPTLSRPGEILTDGLFIVELDFGAVFDGTDLWLEIGVDLGSGPTVLSPRQHLTVAPYALYAAAGPADGHSLDSADGLSIDVVFVDNDDEVGIGTTTPAEKLDVVGNIHASGTVASGNSITIDGTTDTITATGGTISFDDENLTTTGTTTTSALTVSGLDCTANVNGGALTADASGVVSCSDDDDGGAADWNALLNVPAGFADGTDDVGDDWNALTNVPAGFADGTDDVGDDWTALTNVPAGFADGTDDVGDDWTALTNVPAGFADGTDDVVDGDADATNEIQTISGAGGRITLSLGGGEKILWALAAPDADPNPAFSIDNDGNAAVQGGNLRLAKGVATSGVQRTIELRGARPGNGSPFASLDFSNYDNDGANQNQVVARIDAFNADETNSGDLRFYTSGNGTPSLAERMRIREGGRVGVGTDAPDARLDVEDSRCCDQNGNPDRFVANVVNTSTNTGGPDVLWLKTSGVSSPGTNAYFIAFMDANGRVGSVRGNGSGGVQFTTTGADYAEELEQLDATEVIAAGDVVGVFGGKISKRTEGSDWVTVVSGNSAFVGNVSDSSDTAGNRGTVAFMGQVRVKVRGPVAASDYIVASGLEDGTAVAVAPDEMQADPSRRIVGRAWEASQEQAVKLINTTIGLPGADATTAALARTVEDQRLRLEEQARQMSRLRAEVVEMRAAQAELAALRDRLDLLLRRDLVALHRD